MDKVRAYAQLLRIPNVFTAMADVCMGWMIVLGPPVLSSMPVLWEETSSWTAAHLLVTELLLLLGTSACLYSAGMVLNDVFDVEQDRRERPLRPIPSGRVSSKTAAILGVVLLLMGVGLAAAAGPWKSWLPFRLAIALAGCIVLYDGLLKRTCLAPLGMGACRFLNVLLGGCAFGDLPIWVVGHPAGVVGLYIIGVTWFARTEAAESRRAALVAASVVMVSAVVFATCHVMPFWASEWPIALIPLWFWLLIVMLPVAAAIRRPTPQLVQKAVKTCVLGLIGLDATLAFAVVGWPGLLILLLLPPALLLGRWVYST